MAKEGNIVGRTKYTKVELWNYGKAHPGKSYCKHLYTIFPQLTEGEPHQTSQNNKTKDITAEQNLFTNVRGAV